MIWLVEHWKAALGFALLVLAFAAGWTTNGWRYQTKISDMQTDAAIDQAVMSEKYRKVETRNREVTDELAKRNAEAAESEARAREQVAEAVAKYQAAHHAAPAADCGTVLSPDWMHIFDSSAGSSAVPAPAASRSADPLSTALALSTHNNGEAVACQRKLAGWQEWWEKVGQK